MRVWPTGAPGRPAAQSAHSNFPHAARVAQTNNFTNQSNPESFRRVPNCSGENQLLGLGDSDQHRQQFGATGGGNQPQLWLRQPEPGGVHSNPEVAGENREFQPTAHSDAGSQYCSHDYTQTLDDHGVLASIGSVGDAYDNALAESFVDSFKTELIRDRVWRTRSQLELAIVEYVAWFNNERLHTSLGGVPPAEYEEVRQPR